MRAIRIGLHEGRCCITIRLSRLRMR